MHLYDNYIVGEYVVKVEHALLGLPGTEIDQIKTVYSHPQGLLQCSSFLDEKPEWEQVSLQNTAVSAQKVLVEQDRTQAAIASPAAKRSVIMTIIPHVLSLFVTRKNMSKVRTVSVFLLNWRMPMRPEVCIMPLDLLFIIV